MNLNTRKLTSAQVREIRTIWAQRELLMKQLRKLPSPLALAKRHGLSRNALYPVATGRTYKEVQ